MKKEQFFAYVVALTTLITSGCTVRKNDRPNDSTADIQDVHVIHEDTHVVLPIKDVENTPEPVEETEYNIEELIHEPVVVETPEVEPVPIKLDLYAYLNQDVLASEIVDGKEETEIVPQYQKVKVHSLLGDSYGVEFENGRYCILSNIQLDIMPSKFVEVDLSDQKLYIYDDNKLIFSTDVVTGKPSTPTPEGYTEVTYKMKSTYLKGPTWNAYVDYWVPFIANSIGLHDANWQAQFGGDWYVNHGSHGCVNIPPSQMKEVYDSVDVGTPVLVHK